MPALHTRIKAIQISPELARQGECSDRVRHVVEQRGVKEPWIFYCGQDGNTSFYANDGQLEQKSGPDRDSRYTKLYEHVKALDEMGVGGDEIVLMAEVSLRAMQPILRIEGIELVVEE